MYDKLTETVRNALQNAYNVSDTSITWERPQESSHGDLTTPVALQCAKQVGKAPKEIAALIATSLEELDDIDHIDVAGPGYLNIWFTPDAALSHLSGAQRACTPMPQRDGEDPVIVEYSSPNIAKPLGIHHILTTMIGQVMANLYTHLGYNVITVNHIGDWGTQFGKLAVAFDEWGEKELSEYTVDDLLALYVRFHNEAEKNTSLEDRARETFRKLEEGEPVIRTFWKTVVDISMREIHATYQRLNVAIEFDHGESFYEDKMKPILEEGREKGVFVEGKEGALIAEFPEETQLPPAIILKGDGSTIYHTRDLAVIRYRYDTWHPQSILYVVGVQQQLYFQQLFAIVRQMQWDLPTLEHVHFGTMRFEEGKMSTRKGTGLKLDDVLDEAVLRSKKAIEDHGESIKTDDADALAEMMGIGAVVYGSLCQNRKMDIVFSWDKILSLEGNSAPYLQYTHARAHSVLRKAEVDGNAVFPKGITEFTERERSLINKLQQFAAILEEARNTHLPHILTNYLYALCQHFNAFYNADPILKAEEPKRALRLALTHLTATVLKTGAGLLTIRVPERM